MQIIFATHNKGKLKEMKDLLPGYEVMGAEEAGVFEDVIEDGKTFAENALKKARFVAEKTGKITVADDSGICIEALDGEPGIYSARWAGEGASSSDLINLTLDKLKDVSRDQRGAWFESCIALVVPGVDEYTFTGKITGRITNRPIGELVTSLPYDVIFMPINYDTTFAQMTDGEKNMLSHRGIAFAELKEFLNRETFLKQ